MFVDMAHIAGLVAAGVHPSPVPYADFVSSTTHKTLRGPRGGFILAKEKYAKSLDAYVFPGMQGGPLMHVIAGKAVAFLEAKSDKFKEYQKQIVKNSRRFAKALEQKGFRIVSGGTDNHMFLVDLTGKMISGRDAQVLLESVNITLNKNLIPYDSMSPQRASGVRIGTPAITTRGIKEPQIDVIAGFIDEAIKFRGDPRKLKEIKAGVLELTAKFPLYPELKGMIE